MEILVSSGKSLQHPFDFFRTFAEEASAALAPTHWVTVRAWHILSTVAATHKHHLERALTSARLPHTTPFPSPWRDGSSVTVAHFAEVSAEAAMKCIRARECITAGCVGGTHCTHMPTAEMVSDVLWAIADFRLAGVHHDVAARALATRYLPLLSAQFGTNDEDISGIRKWLDSTPAGKSSAARTASAGSVLCSNLKCGAKEQTPGAFKLCGSCHSVRYCGPVCQRADWKAHKPMCVAQRSKGSK